MKFTIDMSKWRCGLQGEMNVCRLGKGGTQLLNDEGYMCCLGQVALQVGLVEADILNMGMPQQFSFEKAIPPLTFEAKTTDGRKIFLTTDLSRLAMDINDSTDTTIPQKREQLTLLFKSFGHELEFINGDSSPQSQQPGQCVSG